MKNKPETARQNEDGANRGRLVDRLLMAFGIACWLAVVGWIGHANAAKDAATAYGECAAAMEVIEQELLARREELEAEFETLKENVMGHVQKAYDTGHDHGAALASYVMFSNTCEETPFYGCCLQLKACGDGCRALMANEDATQFDAGECYVSCKQGMEACNQR